LAKNTCGSSPRRVLRARRPSVYNVNTKSWIAPSEAVEDIEQGKDKTTEYARIYLRHVADSELPPLEWKTSRSR
jgi:hypothetical protein